jgi:hypothetical protein
MLSHLPDDVAADSATLQIVAEAARYATDAVPCLGFILRSTNVRNAFEVHGPLLRLSRKLLARNGLKLILSSEWFASPVNLLSPRVLSDDYILIGQPATESSNPFVIPLAGHELGHSVWAIEGLEKEYKSLIQGAVIEAVVKHWVDYKTAFQPTWTLEEAHKHDLIAISDLAPPIRWCTAQVEEMFCDATGIAIFGEAYLRAFAYQLATLQHTGRSAGYPPMLDRVKSHLSVASHLKVPVPDGYQSWFIKEAGEYGLTPQTALYLKIADEAREAITGNIRTRAVEIVRTGNVLTREVLKIKAEKSGKPDAYPHDDIERCVKEFKRFTPCERSHSLSDIVNAAWRALEIDQFFPDSEHESDKFSHLSDIVLKSIEIHEIEQCLAAEGILITP